VPKVFEAVTPDNYEVDGRLTQAAIGTMNHLTYSFPVRNVRSLIDSITGRATPIHGRFVVVSAYKPFLLKMFEACEDRGLMGNTPKRTMLCVRLEIRTSQCCGSSLCECNEFVQSELFSRLCLNTFQRS